MQITLKYYKFPYILRSHTPRSAFFLFSIAKPRSPMQLERGASDFLAEVHFYPILFAGNSLRQTFHKTAFGKEIYAIS